MAKRLQQSPGLQMILHVWKHSFGGGRKSWERLNGTMRTAVDLAITGELRFDRADFRAVRVEIPGCGHFLDIEHCYTLAVGMQSQSACLAIEHDRERSPIIADDVRARSRNHYSETRQKRGRIAVGSEFTYAGYRPTVTSFMANGQAVACTYHDGTEGERSKIERRFVVGPEEIKADRADRKERDWIIKKALRVWGVRKCDEFLNLLGLDNNAEMDRQAFYRLPRRRIDTALDRLSLEIGSPSVSGAT